MITDTETPDVAMTNGNKRPRPAEPPVDDASHGASEPPSKQLKFPAGFMAHVQQAGDTPEPSKFAMSFGGTQCLGIVMSEPDGKTHTLSGGAKFQTTKTRILPGKLDVAPNIDVDEATNEAVFHIPDADAWKAAYEKKKLNKESGFVKVDKYEDHRVPMDRPHKIDVHETTTLPGVQWPSVVRIEGFECRGKRGKAPVDEKGQPRLDERGNPIPSRIWYGLTAKNIYPLECLGRDPSRIARYIRECGAMTTWHREAPFASEEELKRLSPAGDHPLIMPIVRIDDPEAFGQHFDCSHDRGFQATIRPEAMMSSAGFFYLSNPTKTRLKAEIKAAGGLESDLPNNKQVDLDNCDVFSISATWPMVVMQWDNKRHPGMSQKVPKKFEFQVSAYGTSLWTAGLSHPRHWAIFRYHIPFIGGVVMCQENRPGTCKVSHNVQRHKAMSAYPKEDLHSIGAGAEPFVTQYPKMWSRGVVLDVPNYLRKYGLRCSFKTAAVLMGHRADDCDDEHRKLPIFGKYAKEHIMKKDGKVETEKEVHLNFNPDGFICLNSLSVQTSLRQLNLKIDQYYVLTSMTPKIERINTPDGGSMLSAMVNAKRQAELVAEIKDAEVIDICKQACLSEAERSAMIARAEKPDASPSLRAAGEWLKCSLIGVASEDTDERPAFLVFGTYKPPAALEQERMEESFQVAVRGWTQGPSGAMVPPTRRLNAPALDELDLVPNTGTTTDEPMPALEDPEGDDDDTGDSGEDSQDLDKSGDDDEDEDANMIQATLDYDD